MPPCKKLITIEYLCYALVNGIFMELWESRIFDTLPVWSRRVSAEQLAVCLDGTSKSSLGTRAWAS